MRIVLSSVNGANEVARCFAGHTISNLNRIAALKRFEEPGMRVCLLDLKLGARGL